MTYYDFLCGDIKEEIRKYLIPIPPSYGTGLLPYHPYIDTIDGERKLSEWSNLLTHDAYFDHWSFKRVYKANHSYNKHNCTHVCATSECSYIYTRKDKCFCVKTKKYKNKILKELICFIYLKHIRFYYYK